MNDLITIITLEPEVRRDPKQLANMIVDLAKEIEACKDDLKQIRERNVFKRIFSNNSRDVAEVLIRQNDSMSLFLQIVQALTFLNFYNTAVLGGIQEQLCRFQNKRGEFTSKYLQMANEYISEALTSARGINDQLDTHGAQLKTFDRDLQAKKAQDAEQDAAILALAHELGKHTGRDLTQDKAIAEVLYRSAHQQAAVTYSRKLTVLTVIAICALVLSVAAFGFTIIGVLLGSH